VVNIGAKVTNPLSLDFLCPIGSIVAWAKGLSGVPALPSNWAECNGQTVNGIQTPHINDNDIILRGHTVYNAGSQYISANTGVPTTNLFAYFEVIYIMRVA